jgi:hypothetical protein
MRVISAFGLVLLWCASTLAGPIDRKTFSLSLPSDWTENTHDDMYKPDNFVFFEKGETALFNVIIGEKSAGAQPEQMLRGMEGQWRNKLTNLKFTDLHNWSRYKGTGVELEGEMQEVVRVRTRIFAFQNERYACLIIESASVLDWTKLQSDFEQIRKSFRLK